MTEPEAEVQATANLSPVSPSPVHTAAPLVVPALQDTVDTIDAMVAAATGAADGNADHAIVDPALAAVPADNGDVVDDDSFNDADPYGEESEPVPPVPAQPQSGVDPSDSNDDYAKTFDSPIEPGDGDSQDNEQHVSSSSDQPESKSVPVPSESLNISHSSDAHAVTTQDPSAVTSNPDAAAGQQEIEAESAVESAFAGEQPMESHDDNINQTAPTQSLDGPATSAQDLQESSVDIQKLMADLTAPQSTEAAASGPDPAYATRASAEPPTGSSLPSASSLPPRPPQPHSSSQPYASQHLVSGSNPNAPTATAVAQPPSGQQSAYVAAGAPGTSTDAVTSLPPPPSTGLSVPPAGSPSMNAPFSIQSAPGYSADRGQDVDYQRQWDQFMADERLYMSEAKWDRFPDGSRIFIGMTPSIIAKHLSCSWLTSFFLLLQAISPVTRSPSAMCLTCFIDMVGSPRFLLNLRMVLFSTIRLTKAEPLWKTYRAWR